MADIKVVRNREKKNKNQDYRDKILKYKLTNVYRFLLLLAVFAAVIALVIIQYEKHIYTGYTIVSTVPRQKSAGSVPVRLKDSLLSYSKDGSNCVNLKGEVVWNQTYQMQDIEVALSRNVAALSSYNGNQIYIQSNKEPLGEVKTTMPIREVAVSASGRVSAVLADTEVAWINTYDSQGELLFTGPAHMQNSGYPVAIALSPGGEMMAVSYVYLDAGEVKSHVVFYNFGPVGDNFSDHLVSSYSYSELLVPYLQFMNDEVAFAVGDSRLMIYKGGQKPVPAAEHLYDDEVESVFFNEDYIGLVFTSDDAAHRYRLDVFGADAEKVGSFYFDMEYRDLFFEKDGFVIYNQTECLIMNMNGLEKFRGEFTGSVEVMIPTGKAYRYVLVTGSSLDTIQLN